MRWVLAVVRLLGSCQRGGFEPYDAMWRDTAAEAPGLATPDEARFDDLNITS